VQLGDLPERLRRVAGDDGSCRREHPGTRALGQRDSETGPECSETVEKLCAGNDGGGCDHRVDLGTRVLDERHAAAAGEERLLEQARIYDYNSNSQIVSFQMARTCLTTR